MRLFQTRTRLEYAAPKNVLTPLEDYLKRACSRSGQRGPGCSLPETLRMTAHTFVGSGAALYSFGEGEVVHHLRSIDSRIG